MIRRRSPIGPKISDTSLSSFDMMYRRVAVLFGTVTIAAKQMIMIGEHQSRSPTVLPRCLSWLIIAAGRCLVGGRLRSSQRP
eukprot:scaffold452909_cov18-Prasinocladus_malaysianus.AAC.1